MTDDFSHDFGSFNGRTWLNCAHQGPLPRIAAEEAREAIDWKIAPYELTTERFNSVPARLKSALAQLVGASENEIILGNSASYGLHLLANGIPWRQGDEVLVVAGDFPSDILPWLRLEKQGVRVRLLRPQSPLPDPAELRGAISSRTRLFCTTWVHSFSGFAADLDGLGSVCRQHGVTFVVNASQALGARSLDVRVVPLDAVVSVGFKWLCGPYGTGFCWIKPDLLESLQYNQAYWLAKMTADDLGREGGEVHLPEGLPTARTYNVFGTANFFNFKPWAASVEYLLKQGIERIAIYDQRLVEQFVSGINPKKYDLTSPLSGETRSTLVFISHRDAMHNNEIHLKLKAAGIEAAYRRGKLRFSPHLYNTSADISKALAVLNAI
ncbi:MAG: aminotransferase class V-fold PLP-dependent enzyme [Chloroflexales bacterium]|nr:aminotransferase class V-fold PLP-dependent enzyme [Chloroflexales bacterium]